PTDGSEPELQDVPQGIEFPYFLQDGSLVFVGSGGAPYGQEPKIWRLAGDGSLSVYSDQIYGWSANYIGGITPEGKMVYVYSNQLELTPYDDESSTVFFGAGDYPKIALNPNPSLMVYEYKGNLKTVTLAGQKTAVTDNNYYEGQATLAPDESQIVFVSKRDGSQDLFMMNADGTGVVNLTNTPDLQEGWPDWGP
ncbi:MAG: TolB family protein, partial [Candidatus Sericytochromatia bacterium]